MANQTSFTSKKSSTPNSRIKLSLQNDSIIGSDKDIASLISFTPIRLSTSSSRIKPDHDLDTGSEEDMTNQSSFTSKRLSTPNSTSS